MPPPATVSMVRANKFGVSASKSCKIAIPNVCPKIEWVSLKNKLDNN